MAIQVRRGQFSKFNASKLLPGEWACVLSGDTNVSDGKAIYVCFAAGTVKRMVTSDELSSAIGTVSQAITAAVGALSDDIDAELAGFDGRITAAITAAQTATSAADTAANGATQAKNAANQAAASVNSLYILMSEAMGDCVIATGRANTAAQEARDFIDNYEIDFEHLSDEAIELIKEAAASGAAVITDEEGIGIIDDLADIIVSGNEAGFITDVEGLDIIDNIFM